MSDGPTIRLFYSCEKCALKKVALEVPSRLDEDIAEWMGKTVQLVCSDHFRRSPLCRATTLTQLMIPATDKIGGATKQ